VRRKLKSPKNIFSNINYSELKKSKDEEVKIRRMKKGKAKE
jgi:hypothetical protein